LEAHQFLKADFLKTQWIQMRPYLNFGQFNNFTHTGPEKRLFPMFLSIRTVNINNIEISFITKGNSVAIQERK
jgi:hypothetical protein